MSGLVISDGDLVVFDPMFGPRTVTPLAPAKISGNGHATIGGKKVCVAGDETRLSVNAQYVIPGYAPGSGTISIVSLAPDQQSLPDRSGAPMIVQGSQFIARFTPTELAKMSAPPNTPDVPAPSMGFGRFVPAQSLVQVI